MLERFTAVEPDPGTLYLTATHLIFVDPRNKKETLVSSGTGGAVWEVKEAPIIIIIRGLRWYRVRL